MSRHRTIAAVAVLLAGLVAWWFLLRTGDDGSPARDARPQSSVRAGAWKHKLAQRGTTELKESQAQELAPLAAPHGPAEGMPMTMQRRIAENLNGIGSLRLRFDQAQYERTPAGVGLWIVEGKGVTCLFREETPSSSCRTSLAARRQGIWLETYRVSKANPSRPSHFLALGAVPDGVDAMLVTITGSPRTLRVRNNVWAVRAETPIRHLRVVR